MAIARKGGAYFSKIEGGLKLSGLATAHKRAAESHADAGISLFVESGAAVAVQEKQAASAA